MTINTTLPERPSLEESVLLLGTRARQAGEILAQTSDKRKTQALMTIARMIRENQEEILRQNQEDVKNSQGLSASLLDRLHLTPTRVESMAVSLEEIAALADPIGRRLAAWERPNGLRIERVSVPLGVIGMIYESRPNVTIDAAGLCIKSGKRGDPQVRFGEFFIVSVFSGDLSARVRGERVAARYGSTDSDL